MEDYDEEEYYDDFVVSKLTVVKTDYQDIEEAMLISFDKLKVELEYEEDVQQFETLRYLETLSIVGIETAIPVQQKFHGYECIYEDMCSNIMFKKGNKKIIHIRTPHYLGDLLSKRLMNNVSQWYNEIYPHIQSTNIIYGVRPINVDSIVVVLEVEYEDNTKDYILWSNNHIVMCEGPRSAALLVEDRGVYYQLNGEPFQVVSVMGEDYIKVVCQKVYEILSERIIDQSDSLLININGVEYVSNKEINIYLESRDAGYYSSDGKMMILGNDFDKGIITFRKEGDHIIRKCRSRKEYADSYQVITHKMNNVVITMDLKKYMNMPDKRQFVHDNKIIARMRSEIDYMSFIKKGTRCLVLGNSSRDYILRREYSQERPINANFDVLSIYKGQLRRHYEAVTNYVIKIGRYKLSNVFFFWVYCSFI